MLAVLDLFTADAPVWSADDLITRLGYSRPTGYRYVRELVGAGLLVRLTGGLYHLGPRIIELDRQIREADPVLQTGQPIMKTLAEQTGCHVLLASLYGEQVLNIHHEPGLEKLALTFGRGVPMPLVRGATSKAILAYLPRARLRKVYDRHAKAIARARLGRSWDEFRDALAVIRRQGYCYTGGELDPPNVGVAAPVFAADGDVIGSISFVTLNKRWALIDQPQLIAILCDGAERITRAIASAVAHPARAPRREAA